MDAKLVWLVILVAVVGEVLFWILLSKKRTQIRDSFAKRPQGRRAGWWWLVLGLSVLLIPLAFAAAAWIDGLPGGRVFLIAGLGGLSMIVLVLLARYGRAR